MRRPPVLRQADELHANREVQDQVSAHGDRSMNVFQRNTLLIVLLLQLLPNAVRAAVSGPLKAGAARIEIKPAANAIPRPFTSILDPLYARAIYLENGHDRALL